MLTTRPSSPLSQPTAERRGRHTFGTVELAGEWLDLIARKRRPATVRLYESHLLRFCNWLEGQGVAIAGQISPDVVRLYGQVLTAKEKAGELKAATVNNHINPVRLWLVWLVTEAAVFDRSPEGLPWVTESRIKQYLSTVRDTSRPTRKERALSAAEVGALLSVIDDPRDLAMFSLMAGSGLRVSEACALRAGDVEIRPDGAGIVYVLDGKGGKARELAVAASVVGPVIAWSNAQSLRLGDATDARPLWTPKRGEGRALTRIRVYQLLQRYAKAAGIKHKVSPHNLRHTYGTERYREERDPLAVANALGHSGLAYVQTYVKEVATGEEKPFQPEW